MSKEAVLWYVAGLLSQESDKEIKQHLEHECYAGMVVMQELILALYPELDIPTQRQARDRTWEDWGSAAI